MLKKWTQPICLLLCLLLMCPIHLQASAALPNGEGSTPIQPLYYYTSSTITDIQVQADGTTDCAASAYGSSGITTQIYIKMTLQIKESSGWIDYAVWQNTYYYYYGILNKSLTVPKGTYRVKAEYIVYCGSQYEKITSYSKEDTRS